MEQQVWSWLLTGVGLLGFFLAGRQVWWAWYLNIACQVMWFDYAIATNQHGFMVAAVAYTIIFGRNALIWTKKYLDERMEIIERNRRNDRRSAIETSASRYLNKWN